MSEAMEAGDAGRVERLDVEAVNAKARRSLYQRASRSFPSAPRAFTAA
jgi:hypothetical protein